MHNKLAIADHGKHMANPYEVSDTWKFICMQNIS